MVETFKSTGTIRAIIGDKVVGTLQHPVEIARDWRVYLKSDNPEEEARREAVRRELSERSAVFAPGDKSFLEEYRKMGCEIDVTLGNPSLFPPNGF